MKWIIGQVGSLEGLITSFLLGAREYEAQSSPGFRVAEGDNRTGSWVQAMQLLSFSNSIEFLQITHGERVDAVVTLSRSNLYPTKAVPIAEGYYWVVVSDIHTHLPPFIYLGIESSSRKSLQEEAIAFEGTVTPVELILLFDPFEMYLHPQRYATLLKEKGEEIQKIQFPTQPQAGTVLYRTIQSLAGAEKYLKENFNSVSDLKFTLADLGKKHTFSAQEFEPLPSTEGLISMPATATEQIWKYSLERTVRLQRIRSDFLELGAALAFFITPSQIWENPFAKSSPVGIVNMGTGPERSMTIFTNEIFSNKRLFDDEGQFRTFPPSADTPNISSRFAMISKSLVGVETIVNTMKLIPSAGASTSGFLTLGIGIEQLVDLLAIVNGQTALVVSNGKVLRYVESPKLKITDRFIKEFELKQSEMTRSSGFINLDGEQWFYYSRYPTKIAWPFFYFTLEPAEEVLKPLLELQQRTQGWVKQFYEIILIIAIVVLVGSLIVLEIIARRFTRPISSLAKATSQVAAGKYSEVELPKVNLSGKGEVSVLTRAFSEMVAGLQEREKMRSVLNKVVSKEIADEILKGHVQLGGEVREVAVLFADIRNFTRITELLPPQEVITFVNSYMTLMTEIIEEYHGVIDKYVGDEIMALYGAPLPSKCSTLQAILSAMQIVERLKAWNEERHQKGLLTAEVGIGIHQGPMVAGNMGGLDRLNYTVLGANVNLAARLCDEAKGMEILVSENIIHIANVKEAIVFEFRCNIQFKGFSNPVPVYRVTGLKQGMSMQEVSDFIISCERDDKHA
jgi:class 3 adenylate cyclase